MGFKILRHFSGVLEARNGSRRIFDLTEEGLLVTAKANYTTPKKGS